MTRPWARARGLSLVSIDPSAVATLPAGLRRALQDGVERGYEGDIARLGPGADAYVVRSGGQPVGVLALQRDRPRVGAVTFLAVAIDPAWRGCSLGARALRLAERRLALEGVDGWYATVPRTNGRGLYFMLRCGYAPRSTPPAGEPDAGCTWFARRPSAWVPARSR